MNERMSVKDAARMIEVSESSFRIYCRAGKFETARKVRGTTWMVSREEMTAIANGEKEIDFSGAWEEVYGK